jgi:filamentous hemagglutinin
MPQTVLSGPGYVPDNATIASTGNNSRLPIPETVTADNGLQVESNPKHTTGMQGNRPNAGSEPTNSLDLFNSSIQGGDGVRYAIDSQGNINRFYDNGNGVYHWSGSTGDASAPLNVSKIPIDVRRSLGFKGK